MVRNIPSYLKLQKSATDYEKFYTAKNKADFCDSLSIERRIEFALFCLDFGFEQAPRQFDYFTQELVGRQSPYYEEGGLSFCEDRFSQEVVSDHFMDCGNRCYNYLDYTPYSYSQLDLPFDYEPSS